MLGAAYLAGLGAGLFAGPSDVAAKWRLETTFQPAMDGAAGR